MLRTSMLGSLVGLALASATPVGAAPLPPARPAKKPQSEAMTT